MSDRNRFAFADLAEFRAYLEENDLQLPIDEDLSILGDSVTLGPRVAPNRFVALPMEGFDSFDDGSPGPLSFRRYRRFAEGRTGTLWFEATAVLHEARSNPRQAYLHAGNVDAYARLVEETRRAARERHGHDIVLILQLTHSGRYSKPTGVPEPLIAHRSAVLDPLHKLPDDYPVVTDDYLDRLQDTFVVAARLAAQAGFDGVDVKACHRYLMSELLASFTREGRYGGSFENRTRLLRETLARIREEVPELFITTRLNVFDAIPHPYGFGVDREDGGKPDLEEPLRLIRELKDMKIPLINISIGNPYYNPHYGRPYDRTVMGAKPAAEDPLSGVIRFIGITRQIQQTFPDLPVIAGGYTWLRHLMPYVAAGAIRRGDATLIGQGRGMFAYPGSVDDILSSGRMDPGKACITCSGCTQIMRDGTMTGCVIRDSAIYAEQYRLGRRFALDHLQSEARRCLGCAFPTCQTNCPALVDVPRFLRAFAEGDFAASYALLRERNVLPEMCGCVCPAEVQCEGGCVEQILDGRPIPIRDIQRVVSRIARRQGLVGVPMHPTETGRHVAVVGGGPAGVACAIRLLEKGHQVTLFERGDHLGGTPHGIIPDSRYESATSEIDAILRPALESGRASCRFGQRLGGNLTLDALRKDFDAVFLAPGLGGGVSLGTADGVACALSFLERAKCGEIASLTGKVAVLGGGNTAMDAAVTAKRLGAEDVYIVYRRSFIEMPAWQTERAHAIEAGCHFFVLMQPVAYETDAAGKLTGLKVVRTELGEPDQSGRRSPVAIKGTESTLAVSLAIEAIGQEVPADLATSLAGLERTARGHLKTPEGSFAASVPGIFAGGDIVNGGTTAVQAIREGMEAADEIDAYLSAPPVASAG